MFGHALVLFWSSCLVETLKTFERYPDMHITLDSDEVKQLKLNTARLEKELKEAEGMFTKQTHHFQFKKINKLQYGKIILIIAIQYYYKKYMNQYEPIYWQLPIISRC